ncbi:DUF4148 domain-containing protein [Trinickia terrae]|uniref:DUF4148 domain-containing protein n=1 Tax=Trinickia terrae TaxID=2571161 RepID=A0A4U1IG29_9BURK|nr:DUF4148 domain-containing protein [Trinickia terrae]TKC92662.1 DUF4148 domain-containing protein [Trinickia terrae]
MRSIVYAAVLATVLAAPVASFAQSAEPVTRAQMRAELVQLEKAGYNPASDNLIYSADIQAAEQRVHAQSRQSAKADTSGYGPQVTGAVQSGGPSANANGPMSVYFGR